MFDEKLGNSRRPLAGNGCQVWCHKNGHDLSKDQPFVQAARTIQPLPWPVTQTMPLDSNNWQAISWHYFVGCYPLTVWKHVKVGDCLQTVQIIFGSEHIWTSNLQILQANWSHLKQFWWMQFSQPPKHQNIWNQRSHGSNGDEKKGCCIAEYPTWYGWVSSRKIWLHLLTEWKISKQK